MDGAFWHGHPDHFTFGKSGPSWDAKIRRNMERDKEVDSALFDLGWRSFRAWDFEILEDAQSVARRIAALLAVGDGGRTSIKERAAVPASRRAATG